MTVSYFESQPMITVNAVVDDFGSVVMLPPTGLDGTTFRAAYFVSTGLDAA